MDQQNLKQIILLKDKVVNWEEYPFNIPVIKTFDSLEINNKVCFFVGENGTGKSTLLEAIAGSYSFGREGGSKKYLLQPPNKINVICQNT